MSNLVSTQFLNQASPNIRFLGDATSRRFWVVFSDTRTGFTSQEFDWFRENLEQIDEKANRTRIFSTSQPRRPRLDGVSDLLET